MKFEKKEPQVRPQPFNPHKNPWKRCTCEICKCIYNDDYHEDKKGAITLGWHGESISGGHRWECANCVYEFKVKSGYIDIEEEEE